MASYVHDLINHKSDTAELLSNNVPQQSSFLTNAMANRNNIKSYGQWVNFKFSPPGMFTKLSAKIMSPFCSNPVIGIVLLVGWIIFFIYITWYVTNGKCADLSDDKLKTIANYVSEKEIDRLDAITRSITALTSKFTSDVDMKMINEQTMFAGMSGGDKITYLLLPRNEKEKIYNKYFH